MSEDEKQPSGFPTGKPAAKRERVVKKVWTKPASKEPTTGPVNTPVTTIQDIKVRRLKLYDELFNISKHEREKLILSRYAEEMAEFERKLGTSEFRKALDEFMLEKIEGKLLAARETVEG